MIGSLYTGQWDEKSNKVKDGTAYTGSGIVYRKDSEKLLARFGGIAGNIYSNSQDIINIDRPALNAKGIVDETFTGIKVLVPPHPNDYIDTTTFYSNNRALKIYGDTLSFGANSHFEYSYYGVAASDTIMNWIGVTHKFVFTNVSTDFNFVYLPNYTTISNKLRNMGIPIVSRNNLYPYYELTIIMAYKDQVGNKRIRVQIEPAGGGGLITNDGDILSYIDMGSGDVLTLACSPAAYYIKNHRS